MSSTSLPPLLPHPVSLNFPRRTQTLSTLCQSVLFHLLSVIHSVTNVNKCFLFFSVSIFYYFHLIFFISISCCPFFLENLLFFNTLLFLFFRLFVLFYFTCCLLCLHLSHLLCLPHVNISTHRYSLMFKCMGVYV